MKIVRFLVHSYCHVVAVPCEAHAYHKLTYFRIVIYMGREGGWGRMVWPRHSPYAYIINSIMLCNSAVYSHIRIIMNMCFCIYFLYTITVLVCTRICAHIVLYLYESIREYTDYKNLKAVCNFPISTYISSRAPTNITNASKNKYQA